MVANKTFFNLPEEKQKRVIDIAIEEFSEKGYKGASTNQIVSKLGIAKGSIYQYFTNKKSLFLYIFDYAVELVRKHWNRSSMKRKIIPSLRGLRNRF